VSRFCRKGLVAEARVGEGLTGMFTLEPHVHVFLLFRVQGKKDAQNKTRLKVKMYVLIPNHSPAVFDVT
jgi:hypothetical protein